MITVRQPSDRIIVSYLHKFIIIFVGQSTQATHGHNFSMMSFHFLGVARHSLNEASSPQHSDGPGNDFLIFRNTAWSTASAWWPEQLQQERSLWGMMKNALG